MGCYQAWHFCTFLLCPSFNRRWHGGSSGWVKEADQILSSGHESRIHSSDRWNQQHDWPQVKEVYPWARSQIGAGYWRCQLNELFAAATLHCHSAGQFSFDYGLFWLHPLWCWQLSFVVNFHSVHFFCCAWNIVKPKKNKKFQICTFSCVLTSLFVSKRIRTCRGVAVVISHYIYIYIYIYIVVVGCSCESSVSKKMYTVIVFIFEGLNSPYFPLT